MVFGGHGFNILLFPGYKDLVARSGLDQEKVDTFVKNCGQTWLDALGYNKMCKYLWNVHITWGEWGPEHISVPGTACGLDIELGPLGGPRGSASLQPHNIDAAHQVMLLLIAFTEITDHMVVNEILKEYEPKKGDG